MSILKVSVGQVKAARSLLNWSQEHLANASGVSLPTIKRLEGVEVTSQPLGGSDGTINSIRTALENAGITFLEEGEVANGPGVSLK